LSGWCRPKLLKLVLTSFKSFFTLFLAKISLAKKQPLAKKYVVPKNSHWPKRMSCQKIFIGQKECRAKKQSLAKKYVVPKNSHWPKRMSCQKIFIGQKECSAKKTVIGQKRVLGFFLARDSSILAVFCFFQPKIFLVTTKFLAVTCQKIWHKDLFGMRGWTFWPKSALSCQEFCRDQKYFWLKLSKRFHRILPLFFFFFLQETVEIWLKYALSNQIFWPINPQKKKEKEKRKNHKNELPQVLHLSSLYRRNQRSPPSPSPALWTMLPPSHVPSSRRQEL
jgi:hypothetical protein